MPMNGAVQEKTTIYFRFYAELNDFVARDFRMKSFAYTYNGRQSVKHLIEAAGVPHTEVDLILVNGTSVDFSYKPSDGDRISVYPVFEALDIASVSLVRPQPLRRTRFVLDSQLGRLAVYLRMLGFDALYRNDYPDDELVLISLVEGRVLLTRDRSLLMRGTVTHGYFVRQGPSRNQLTDVLRRFDLTNSTSPLTRCLVCNDPLVSVSRDLVAGSVPARSRAFCSEFWQCSGCGRVYWNGSHYKRMLRFADQAVRAATADPETKG